MSHAQMIAKAWLDDGYRATLIAQGLDVPPRPNDLADEELDTGARADSMRLAEISTDCFGCVACTSCD
jgi:hypothetical protein